MHVLLVPMLAVLVLAGCQSAPVDYERLAERVSDGERVAPAELRRALFAAPDGPLRIERLSELEQQALALLEDEPLKLGSVGTAIIDTYYGSLTGHYILARFYRHLENAGAAATHEAWVDRIRADIEDSGHGDRERPYQALTPVEAQVYVLSRGWVPLGSIYQSGEEVPLSLLLQVRKEAGPLANLNFDLTRLYEAMRAAFGVAHGDAEFSPLNVIGYLAKQGDSAAQAAIGTFLASQHRSEDAVNWLRAATRTGNLVANAVLARIFWEEARQAEDEQTRDRALGEVMEHYLLAVALGSSEAMYALGVLYLNGHYGDENQEAGVPLLRQAAELEHSDAIMFLAHLHYAGDLLDRDLDAARAHYVRAAELDNPYAQRSYARFLLDRDANQPGDPRALAWLQALAGEGDAESMLLLGNLTARGLGTAPSARRAIAWFKRAVRTAPQDANIVNEVAWTLTVSDQAGLRRARYARGIMDTLMETNAQARERPEYLDTWAATYAATGDFERAVALQELAVAAAANGDFGDVEDILRKHLEHFRSGRTISETVP
jgi:TPR repeat protein